MRKIILLPLAVLCSLLLTAQAPDINWQKTLGGTDIDAGHAIQATSDGGYIIAASSDSQDGDVGTGGQGDYDIWIIKMDVNGNIQWKNTYGGSDWEWPYAIKPTSDGGYIVAGFTHSDDGDISGFQGFRDAWVIKLDAMGNLQWQNSLGGSNADTARDIIEVGDGYIMVGKDGGGNDGDLQGTGCNDNFWIVKLNYSGEIVWQKCHGGSDIDLAKKITPLGSDQFIVVGYTTSDDGDVTGHHGYEDFWVIAIDTDGNLLWQKALGGSSVEEANDVVVNNTMDQIIVVGEVHSEDGDVSTHYGDLDFWVVFLDTNGTLLSNKTYGGNMEDNPSSILPLSSGNFIISGVSGSSDGDVTGNHGSGDFWVINIDASGNLIWNKSMGGSNFENSLGSALATDDEGIILVGHTNSNDGDVSGLQGDDDLWFVKLGGMPSGVESIFTLEEPLKIFPNPIIESNVVHIQHQLLQAEQLFIRDIYGQTVLEKSIANQEDMIKLSVEGLPSGSYLLELRSARHIQVGKFVVINYD